MKLKTSFFNESVLHKNITRFAPLWGIYLVMGILVTFFIDVYDYEFESAQYASVLCVSMLPMVAVNFIYAFLSAILLFGDLHKTRMCYSLHAMPLRREGWFLTHVASGLAFSLIPNLIVSLVMLAKCGSYFYVPLAWLLVCTLQYLCFFGIGVFCMHITGNSFASFCMYLLINFFSMVLYVLTELYFAQFWNSVIIPTEPFEKFSPALQLVTVFLKGEFDNLTGRLLVQWQNMGLGFLWAGIGVVFLVLALLVYRKRQLESAGEFITLRPAAPVVLVLYSLGVGGVLWAMFNYNYFVLLLGLALGFFTGRMLLQRTLKVFGKRNFLGYGILTACVLLCVGLAILDPVGITRWVPGREQVEYVSLGYSSYSVGHSNIRFTSDEDVERVLQLHKDAIEHSVESPKRDIFSPGIQEDTTTVCIYYQLSNGASATRVYTIPVGGEGGKLLHQLSCEPEFLFEGMVDETLQLQALLTSVDFYSHNSEDGSVITLSQEQYAQLLQVLELDRQSGALSQRWDFHSYDESVGSLELMLLTPDGRRYLSLNIFTSCTNTLTWLKANGYLE